MVSDACDSGESGLFSQILMSTLDCVSEATDSGEDDLLLITETDSVSHVLNSGIGESPLWSSPETTESGEDGLTSEDSCDGDVIPYSKSEQSETGDDVLSSVVQTGTSGKVCLNAGMGDSGESGLFSSAESGDDGLFSSNNNGKEIDIYSGLEFIDSIDEDRSNGTVTTDSGKDGLNSGIGESGDSAWYMFTEAIESAEAGLSSITNEMFKSVSRSIFDNTDSGDTDLQYT